MASSIKMESHGEPLDPKDSAIRSYFEQLYADDRDRMVITERDQNGGVVDVQIIYTQPVNKTRRRPHKWESEQERKEWFATHANQLEHWWDEPQLDDH